MEVRNHLERAAAAGMIREIDYRFALFLDRLAGTMSPFLPVVAALVSRAAGGGHICLPLEEVTGKEVFPASEDEALRLPDASSLRRQLLSSGVVGTPGRRQPLILDEDNRLYLHRFFSYEKIIADDLLRRSAPLLPVETERAAKLLEMIFPGSDHGNQQKTAAAAALCKQLLIISGGPGTGKTYTVARILAILTTLADPPLRIAMAAPTGKAAARLSQSIRAAGERLPGGWESTATIPGHASTLHRLLGVRPGGRFRRNSDNPLPLDLLVVDEASMIDIPLMARLLSALPPRCRLILLGDRDQLASVEAGSLFADLCSGAGNGWSQAPAARLEALTGNALNIEEAAGFNDSLLLLEKSYRFHKKSGIGRLAAAVNSGNRAALQRVMQGGYDDLDFFSPRDSELAALVEARVAPGFAASLDAAGPHDALAILERQRVLCALREGPYGVAGMNGMVEAALRRRGLIRDAHRWYRGRPLLITANHHGLGLFNGDIGIVWPDEQGRPRAWFPEPSGGLRSIAPTRLPEHETAYAVTVHKSQGSEFERVILVLPLADSEILSAELIYTGITRARKALEIWAPRQLMETAIGRRVRRHSGLAVRLWGKERVYTRKGAR